MNETLTEFQTLPDAVRHQVATRPDAEALTAGGTTCTYAELGAAITCCRGHLAAVGVGPGDRVVLVGANSIAWVLAFLATLDMGAVALPTNYRLSAPELAEQFALTEPRVVLADEDFLETAEPGAATVGAEVRTLHLDRRGRSLWNEQTAHSEPAELDPGALALISFTAGSTGTPKGAQISHRALAVAAGAYADALGTGPDDRTLVMVPLFHNTGFCDQLAHILLVGGTVDLLRVFSRAASREALCQRPATFLIAVPGILRLLMIGERADEVFASCRHICYGGSPMPGAWIHEMAARWPQVRLYNCYGLTEFTSISHILMPEDVRDHAGSAGRPVRGVKQRIVDTDGNELHPGETGLLLVAGPSRMMGYWRRPELTEQAFQGEWLVTGDLGHVTPEGFLMLAGRASEVINRGGEKIMPLQVEDALSQQAGVAEAVVVGAPHPIFGQCVVAFVTPKNGVSLDQEEIRHALREHVADYAVPERFVMSDELPRTAAGKLDRTELARIAAAATSERVS